MGIEREFAIVRTRYFNNGIGDYGFAVGFVKQKKRNDPE